jgi:tight adherence protein C
VAPLTLLILGATLLVGFGVTQLPMRRAARRRLARLAAPVGPPAPRERGVLTQQPGAWLRWLPRFTRSDAVVPGALRERLAHAGYRQSSAPTAYQAARVGLALGAPLAALLAGSLWSFERSHWFLTLGGAAAIGYVLPSFWLDRRRAARQRDVLLGLPDALDLMVVCVEAGLGINASLARIARELATTHRVLASELEWVTLEIRAGKSTTEALRALAMRTGVTEVSALVAMLIQTERFGTSLRDTLRVHAGSMRVRRMQRAEEIAGRAPLKMMFPTVLIFLATLIVTIGPGFMQISNFFRER